MYKKYKNQESEDPTSELIGLINKGLQKAQSIQKLLGCK